MNYVPSNQSFRISQSIEVVGILTTSATIPTFASQAFAISQLDQVTSLSSVFDQYKIDEIEVWIAPAGITTGTNLGLLTSVVDYDDVGTLSTVAQALDYTNALTTTGFQGHYRRWKPHVATAAYSGAFTSFANEVSPWLDFASPGVQHFGLKLAAQPTVGSTIPYNMIARFHVQMRNVR